ncbi:metalloregulator ArsR/SmtB family transcription factor [Carboxydocella sp. JDF658]|uniref:ArsR/SmtB family transcription factor n=1 Tax=Carboxydocella sp. JDF658 TaxID=1926600 RepID=UPI0009ADA777|nr:metalloregulator ArsR/SmtB family transcription factor [Carboxydocella sp. JDF658]GAW30582.1 transcriptional regulator [Carboxydocella sp. JDF658]
MKELAEKLRALADENRLQIIRLLARGELCVCEIMEYLEMSQPTASHHLKILKQAGLVTDRKEGRWSYYRLQSEAVQALTAEIQGLLVTGEPLPPRPASRCQPKE